jgi:hypothetical protein
MLISILHLTSGPVPLRVRTRIVEFETRVRTFLGNLLLRRLGLLWRSAHDVGSVLILAFGHEFEFVVVAVEAIYGRAKLSFGCSIE